MLFIDIGLLVLPLRVFLGAYIVFVWSFDYYVVDRRIDAFVRLWYYIRGIRCEAKQIFIFPAILEFKDVPG